MCIGCTVDQVLEYFALTLNGIFCGKEHYVKEKQQ